MGYGFASDQKILCPGGWRSMSDAAHRLLLDKNFANSIFYLALEHRFSSQKFLKTNPPRRVADKTKMYTITTRDGYTLRCAGKQLVARLKENERPSAKKTADSYEWVEARRLRADDKVPLYGGSIEYDTDPYAEPNYSLGITLGALSGFCWQVQFVHDAFSENIEYPVGFQRFNGSPEKLGIHFVNRAIYKFVGKQADRTLRKMILIGESVTPCQQMSQVVDGSAISVEVLDRKRARAAHIYTRIFGTGTTTHKLRYYVSYSLGIGLRDIYGFEYRNRNELPFILNTAHLRTIRGYLQAMFLFNGSPYVMKQSQGKKKSKFISSKNMHMTHHSRELLEDIQLLLLGLGIRSRIKFLFSPIDKPPTTQMLRTLIRGFAPGYAIADGLSFARLASWPSFWNLRLHKNYRQRYLKKVGLPKIHDLDYAEEMQLALSSSKFTADHTGEKRYTEDRIESVYEEDEKEESFSIASPGEGYAIVQGFFLRDLSGME